MLVVAYEVLLVVYELTGGYAKYTHLHSYGMMSQL